MSAAPRSLLTIEDYLRIERAATRRSEFYRGEMFAMAGGSPQHSLIKMNLAFVLTGQLRGKPCTAYDNDLRIRIKATGLYTYPDGSVICGDIEFDDAVRDTALNPTVLIEVLSPTTEAYDRGKKWAHYQQIPSLREYLLISQDCPKIERFQRNADDTWTLTTSKGLETSLSLPSIEVTLPLAEVYDKVEFVSEQPRSTDMP